MATETDIAIIEINNSLKHIRNSGFVNEQITKSLTEAERLLKLKDSKISEMKEHLEFILEAYDSGAVIIPNAVFKRIKELIK